MTSSEDIIKLMVSLRNETQAHHLMRFFKTGKGQYGEGDMFLGLRVPQIREIVKRERLKVALQEIEKLIYSQWHEVRMAGFLLLVEEMKAATARRKSSATTLANRRDEIVAFYLQHAHQANNWDLVDLSCYKILGEWLLHPDATGQLPSSSILDDLSQSPNLWRQRIAIVSTMRLIKADRFEETERMAEKLLNHPHDLIHKAIGWMLREMGKRDIEALHRFLNRNLQRMPRTALRYAIERLPEAQRLAYLQRPI